MAKKLSPKKIDKNKMADKNMPGKINRHWGLAKRMDKKRT